MSVTRRSALGGIVWTVGQRWAVRLTTLAVFVILGRLLSPHDFGVVALAGVFVGFLNVFSDFGLSTYLVQARSIDRRVTSTVFWCGLALSLVIAGLLVAASSSIASAFDTSELKSILQVLSIGIVISAFSSTPTALLKRKLDFRTIAMRSVLATILSAAAAVGLAFAGAGAWALVGQSLAFSTVSAVVLWLASDWRPGIAFDVRLAMKAMAYGSNVLGIQLVAQVKRRGVDLVIGSVAGTTALGYWTVASRILAVVFDTIVQAISAVSTPVFARLQDDLPRLQRAYVTAVTVTLGAIVPVLAALLVSAPYAIPLAFGERWNPSIPVAQVMCLTTLFTTLVYFDRGLMLAVGRARTEFLVALGSTLGGLAVITPVARHGLVPAAAALLAAAVVTWPWRLRISSRALSISALSLAIRQGRTVLAGGIALLSAYLLEALVPADSPDWVMSTILSTTVMVCYALAMGLINRPVLAEVRSLLGTRSKTPQRKRGSSKADVGRPGP